MEIYFGVAKISVTSPNVICAIKTKGFFVSLSVNLNDKKQCFQRNVFSFTGNSHSDHPLTKPCSTPFPVFFNY